MGRRVESLDRRFTLIMSKTTFSIMCRSAAESPSCERKGRKKKGSDETRLEITQNRIDYAVGIGLDRDTTMQQTIDTCRMLDSEHVILANDSPCRSIICEKVTDDDQSDRKI
jgi:hypothetical protein